MFVSSTSLLGKLMLQSCILFRFIIAHVSLQMGYFKKTQNPLCRHVLYFKLCSNFDNAILVFTSSFHKATTRRYNTKLLLLNFYISMSNL